MCFSFWRRNIRIDFEMGFLIGIFNWITNCSFYYRAHFQGKRRWFFRYPKLWLLVDCTVNNRRSSCNNSNCGWGALKLVWLSNLRAKHIFLPGFATDPSEDQAITQKGPNSFLHLASVKMPLIF